MPTAGQVAATAGRHLELLRQMIRIRRFGEISASAFRATRIRDLLRSYAGQEAIAVGAMYHLMTTDAVVTSLGDPGHALARGLPMESVLAQLRRGEAPDLYDAERRFHGGDAVVRGGLPVAIGAALGDRLRGLRRVTACFFTTGDSEESELHECMNLAAGWHLPLLLCCVSNPPVANTQAVDPVARASSYAMPAWTVDGSDVLAVDEATKRAVDTIRGGGGPCLLELRIRLRRRRTAHDPIDALARRMRAGGELSRQALRTVRRAVDDEIRRAIANAGPAAPSQR